jgi:hypothetical protein
LLTVLAPSSRASGASSADGLAPGGISEVFQPDERHTNVDVSFPDSHHRAINFIYNVIHEFSED